VLAEPTQSALLPASAAAELIHTFAVVMSLGAALVFAAVVAFAAIGVFGRPRRAPTTTWIVGGGVVLPVVVLSVLLIAALLAGEALLRPGPAPVARIQVVAHQWWWEVRYLPPDRPAASALGALLESLCGAGSSRIGASAAPAAPAIVLANELRLPVGQPVLVELTTSDVIHSFWVPALAGKVDMVPGRVTRMVLQPARAGVFRGQCAEFCGGPHGLRAFHVVALPETAYREWLRRQAAPAGEPADAALAEGRAAFMRSGCAACHAIRGTPAAGSVGPDLTHLASRRTIAAGTLANHVGTLAGWIADPQAVKPGNRMPATTTLSGAELRALAAYLASLE
jgi:cytochrome c oxidase subunit 2